MTRNREHKSRPALLIRGFAVGALLLSGAGGIGGAVAAAAPPAAEAGGAASTITTADAIAPAKVGERAPDFKLIDTEGRGHRLADYLGEGKTVVLEWFNPDCPFVKRHHERERTMSRLYKEYQSKDVVWLAVNSGAPGKQGYGQDRNRAARKEFGIPYPVLLDESGRVGLLYGAKTTPHMFIIRGDGTLVYEGGIDDDPRGSKSNRVNYVETALKQHVNGAAVHPAQTDAYGCSVKYAAPKAPGKSVSM